jgi:polar amino acid transport system substrate-binding protein
MLALAAVGAAAAQQGPELRWGGDPSGGAPFAFFDPNDPSRVIGFEVDIMDALAKRLGRTPALERADWLALFDALEAKRCDILMNGFEVTEDRAAVARFSVPYFRYGQQIVVRAADAARVSSLADLAGKRVAVLNGSAAVDVLREAGFPDTRSCSTTTALRRMPRFGSDAPTRRSPSRSSPRTTPPPIRRSRARANRLRTASTLP